LKLFAPVTNASDYVRTLNSPAATAKFKADYAALRACDALVLVLPAGADAHAEFGFVAGRNCPVFVLLPDAPSAPELMYLFPNAAVVANVDELLAHLRQSPAIRKIYVASSWTRSLNHPAVVAALRAAEFEVFDYRAGGIVTHSHRRNEND